LKLNQSIRIAPAEQTRYCIEIKPNHFHCHSWSGTDTALENQTIPFCLPRLVRNRYCIETKPNHFHCPSWSGSGDIFGPENLMDKNVVLVTFNYRHTSNYIKHKRKPRRRRICTKTRKKTRLFTLNTNMHA